jgi:hypothetical protein
MKFLSRLKNVDGRSIALGVDFVRVDINAF